MVMVGWTQVMEARTAVEAGGAQEGLVVAVEDSTVVLIAEAVGDPEGEAWGKSQHDTCCSV